MIARLVIALLTATLAAPGSAQSGAKGSARPGEPVLIAAEPLAGAPAGVRAYRIRYRSTGIDGAPVVVTGAVIVPAGRAPAGGRDIVAWAHGTSGIADTCAPSVNDWLFGSIAGLGDLLGRGYIVAATDYEGLGGPGVHPYLVGPSAANSVLDAVRAAREVPRAAASNRFAVWGESQGGHAALWAGQRAPGYAPDLELVGVAAAAPPVDLATNLSGNSNAGVRALLTAFTAASWTQVYDIPLATITRPVGADLIRRLARNCVTLDGFKLRTQIGLMRLIGQLRGVDLAASPRWAAPMRANSVAVAPLGVPLLIAQGAKDVIVAPEVTRRFVGRMCRAGQRLRFVVVEGGDHVTIGKRTAATTTAWLADRFAGPTAPDDCGRLPR